MAEELDAQRCWKVAETKFKPRNFGFRAYVHKHAIMLTFSTVKRFRAVNIPRVFIQDDSSHDKRIQDPLILFKSTGGLLQRLYKINMLRN